jgi:hypothetical protein
MGEAKNESCPGDVEQEPWVEPLDRIRGSLLNDILDIARAASLTDQQINFMLAWSAARYIPRPPAPLLAGLNVLAARHPLESVAEARLAVRREVLLNELLYLKQASWIDALRGGDAAVIDRMDRERSEYFRIQGPTTPLGDDDIWNGAGFLRGAMIRHGAYGAGKWWHPPSQSGFLRDRVCDAVQDLCLHVHQHPGEYDPLLAPPAAYALTFGCHILEYSLRRRWPLQLSGSFDQAGQGGQQEEELLSLELELLRGQIYEQLPRLTPKERAIIEAVLDGTVRRGPASGAERVTRHRAIAHLRELLRLNLPGDLGATGSDGLPEGGDGP